MRLDVRDIDQCGGGSYVVIYDADVDMVPGDGPVTVDVRSTWPDQPDPELLELSVAAIRIGAESVLRPRGLQATMTLEKLAIHVVHCIPGRYQSATVRALTAALDAGSPHQE